MEAGRELDALIAQKVFGYTLDYEFADMMFDVAPRVKELRDENDEWGILPYYSTDIGDAWQVVEKMRLLIRPSVLHNKWVSGIFRRVYGDGKIEIDHEVTSDSAPLAICLTALKAIDDHNQH